MGRLQREGREEEKMGIEAGVGVIRRKGVWYEEEKGVGEAQEE